MHGRGGHGSPACKQHTSSCEVNQGQHNYSKEEEHTISGSAELRFLSGFMQLTQSRGAREYGSIMEINDFADPTEEGGGEKASSPPAPMTV